MERQEHQLTKKIVDLHQVEDGAINPKTGLTEKPSWYVRFEDMSDRVLFKSRLLELLSMGFRKTVENFKAGKATTSVGGEARFWVVVFQDYEVRLQTKTQIMEVVTEGHRHREDDDNARFERRNGNTEEQYTLE
jgi:hypothetical protein